MNIEGGLNLCTFILYQQTHIIISIRRKHATEFLIRLFIYTNNVWNYKLLYKYKVV